MAKDNIVISDVRFPNEILSIKNAGGKIVWVQRGELPEWYNSAIQANQGSNIGLNEMKYRKIHSSEWAWVGTDFDSILTNDGTLEDLYNQIESVLGITVSD